MRMNCNSDSEAGTPATKGLLLDRCQCQFAAGRKLRLSFSPSAALASCHRPRWPVTTSSPTSSSGRTSRSPSPAPGTRPSGSNCPRRPRRCSIRRRPITVISDQTIRKQNLLTLRDVLQTIPGHHLRRRRGRRRLRRQHQPARLFGQQRHHRDGVRDSAQYSRTDPFNLQQIEVYNGANSVFNGSGSVGGTINLVSKTPQADDLDDPPGRHRHRQLLSRAPSTQPSRSAI